MSNASQPEVCDARTGLGNKARRVPGPCLVYRHSNRGSAIRALVAAGCLVAAGSRAHADISVPLALSSDPSAPYTIYLDFGGFTFDGNWGPATYGYAPGVTPAYGDATGAFSNAELANIKQIWSSVAEVYAPFNVDVTTVDPAVAANQARSDTSRQDYYDERPRIMHTVIGGSGAWYGSGGYGGTSYVGVTATSQPLGSGYHTNFVFSDNSYSNLQDIAAGVSHENGHGLGLNHQSDYNGNTLVNEYSAGTGTGPGSVAPIMGDSSYAQRGLWAVGTADASSGGAPSIQNDAKIIVNDPNMGGFFNDRVGHAITAPTVMPLIGNSINSTLAKGVIVPSSALNPNPIGTGNYTADFWYFHTSGGAVSITANAGRSTITAGVPDPGATLNVMLRIFNSNDGLIATSAASAGNLSKTLSLSLTAGNYSAEIMNTGNATDTTFATRNFFDMGSYFLTGTIPVPEPATLGLMAMGGAALLLLGRKRKSA